MAYLAFSLAFMAGGSSSVRPERRPAVPREDAERRPLGDLVNSLWQGRTAELFAAFVLFTEAVLLFVAAQTGFLGGPQVLSNMGGTPTCPTGSPPLRAARDEYGVYFMGDGVPDALITGGSVRYLVIMYSINVFLTFSFSQFGMCPALVAGPRVGGEVESGSR